MTRSSPKLRSHLSVKAARKADGQLSWSLVCPCAEPLGCLTRSGGVDTGGNWLAESLTYRLTRETIDMDFKAGVHMPNRGDIPPRRSFSFVRYLRRFLDRLVAAVRRGWRGR